MGKQALLKRQANIKKNNPLVQSSTPTGIGANTMASSNTQGAKNTSTASPVGASQNVASKVDRMDVDQKSVYDTFSDKEKEAYKKRISGMKDDEVDTYNVMNLTDFDLMLGTVIDGSRQSAKSMAKTNTKLKALEEFGYYGGVLMRYKSERSGYKMREVIKNYARAWAKDEVDKEFDKRKSALGQGSSNKLKVEELEMRRLYLNAYLYKAIKLDLLQKLDDEAETVTADTMSVFGGLLDDCVRQVAIDDFKFNFKDMLEKNKALSPEEKLNVSKIEAMKKTFESKVPIANMAYQIMRDDILKYTSIKSMMREDKINHDLTHVMDKGKEKHKGVTKESAVDYLYGDESEQVSGEKKIEDQRRLISEKMSNNEITTPDLNKGLKYYAMFAMNNVPKDGDTASAATVIKVPVSAGVALKFKVGGENEREGEYVSSKANVGVAVSGDIGISSLSGEIGGFIQAKAKTPENMAMLISYVMYRKARESKVVPHQLTDAVWGMGNITGQSKYNEAESFGAAAEKQLFGANADDENKAVHGEYAKFSAELGLLDGDLGVEASIKASAARTYSKSSFEKGHAGENRLGRVEDYKRFGQDTKGDLGEAIVFEGGISGLNLKGSFGAEMKLAGKTLKEFTLSGSAQYMVHSDYDGGEAVTGVMTAIGDILSNLKKIKTTTDKVLHKKNVQTKGNYDNDFQKKIEMAQVGSEKIAQHVMIGVQRQTDGGIASQSGFKISFAYTKNIGGEGEVTISLDNVQTLGVDLKVIKTEIEKTHRIVKWSSNDGIKM